MPADRDLLSEDTNYAAHLLALARQELAEVQSAASPAVAAVVLQALIELLEDAANGYVTLAGLGVAIRQGRSPASVSSWNCGAPLVCRFKLG